MSEHDAHKWDDHNLLIRLDQKVGDLQNAVKELNDGTFSKIAGLEKDKADRRELEVLQVKINTDIETRVRVLENSNSRYLILTAIYSAIGATMIGLIIFHIFYNN